jgi:hypothetical protein
MPPPMPFLVEVLTQRMRGQKRGRGDLLTERRNEDEELLRHSFSNVMLSA